MRRRLLVGNQCNINFDIIDKADTVAGDICIVCNSTSDKYFIESDTISLINSEEFTPIGVVVVPASHTDDGTARIISLVAMDYNNPDNGNTSTNIEMAWGGSGYNVTGLNGRLPIPLISNTGYSGLGSTQTLVEWNTTVMGGIYYFLSSDVISNNYPNPFDEGTYFNNSTVKNLLPSPYITGGGKNPIYHSTANTGNVLSDMSGKNNTNIILALDNSSSIDWQTSETIQNIGNNEFIHPAAQCCWRYHTIGTMQGDWYLPAAGELGYLIVRFDKIGTSIEKIDSFNFTARVFGNVMTFWSSTQNIYTGGIAFTIASLNGVYTRSSKSNNDHVRAFLAV